MHVERRAGRATAILVIGMATVGNGLFARVLAQGKACGLATPEELQAAMGGPVTALKSHPVAGGGDVCMGQTPTATILLRLAARTGKEGAEAAGVESARRLGAQVEVKTEGPITCSSMVPPKGLEQYGFNTTCAVFKSGQVAAVEVTAKSQKDMVPVERLRTLAGLIARRF
jgi:hypothetical protein